MSCRALDISYEKALYNFVKENNEILDNEHIRELNYDSILKCIKPEYKEAIQNIILFLNSNN